MAAIQILQKSVLCYSSFFETIAHTFNSLAVLNTLRFF